VKGVSRESLHVRVHDDGDVGVVVQVFSYRRTVRPHLDIELVSTECEVPGGVVARLRHGQVRACPCGKLVMHFLLSDVAAELDFKPGGCEFVVLGVDCAPEVEPVLQVGVVHCATACNTF
jgi:hypothetical protein